MKETIFDDLSNLNPKYVEEANIEPKATELAEKKAKQAEKKTERQAKTKKNIKPIIIRTALALAAAAVIGVAVFFAVKAIKKAGPVFAYAENISADYQGRNEYQGNLPDEFPHAMNEFAFNMFSKTVSSDNVVESPFSLAMALAMLVNGTDGNTKNQLETVLGLDETTLNRAAYIYAQKYADNSVLTVANSIWVPTDQEVKNAFLQTNADWHSADVFKLPFDSKAINDINKWCSAKTNGKIYHIIDDFGPNVVFELINATYFKDQWYDKYKSSNIFKADFHNYNQTTTNVTFLYSQEHTFLYDDDFVGFAKRYESGSYKFVALLPNEDIDIVEFAKSFTAEKWEEAWENKIAGEEVRVKMPEFENQCVLNLVDVLSKMGVTDLFDTSADLTRFDGSENAAPGEIFVGKAIQKNYIKLNREGTEASSVSLFEGKNKQMQTIPKMEVVLDRPFVYMIVDDALNIPVFIGTVTNL